MCSGTIVQFRVPRVVIGENRNFGGNEEFLRGNGGEVVILDDENVAALMARFIAERRRFGMRRSARNSDRRRRPGLEGANISPNAVSSNRPGEPLRDFRGDNIVLKSLIVIVVSPRAGRLADDRRRNAETAVTSPCAHSPPDHARPLGLPSAWRSRPIMRFWCFSVWARLNHSQG